jgi:hypothetical protein
MSGNLALEQSSAETRNFAPFQKKDSSVKQTGLRNMFKMAPKSACTSTVVVSPDPLSPTLINFFIYEDYKTQHRTMMTLNQQMKETSKWNMPLISSTAQVQQQ